MALASPVLGFVTSEDDELEGEREVSPPGQTQLLDVPLVVPGELIPPRSSEVIPLDEPPVVEVPLDIEPPVELLPVPIPVLWA